MASIAAWAGAAWWNSEAAGSGGTGDDGLTGDGGGDAARGPGDVATVFGGLVSLDEQAALAGTISYELLTALGPRIPRRYEGAA